MHWRVEDALKTKPVACKVHRHDSFPAPIHSPADFAAQLGYELERVTKTLLVRATTGDQYAVVVAPMGRKIDFREVAGRVGAKRVEVASAADLSTVTGYPEKGVSPLGLDKLAVFVDEGLFAFSTILVGAGEAGVEIEIAPSDLELLTSATRAPLAVVQR